MGDDDGCRNTAEAVADRSGHVSRRSTQLENNRTHVTVAVSTSRSVSNHEDTTSVNMYDVVVLLARFVEPSAVSVPAENGAARESKSSPFRRPLAIDRITDRPSATSRRRRVTLLVVRCCFHPRHCSSHVDTTRSNRARYLIPASRRSEWPGLTSSSSLSAIILDDPMSTFQHTQYRSLRLQVRVIP